LVECPSFKGKVFGSNPNVFKLTLFSVAYHYHDNGSGGTGKGNKNKNKKKK
jgi:hypothetical protein